MFHQQREVYLLETIVLFHLKIRSFQNQNVFSKPARVVA